MKEQKKPPMKTRLLISTNKGKENKHQVALGELNNPEEPAASPGDNPP